MEQVGEILIEIVKYGGALFAIFGVIFAVWHWVQKQNAQSEEIAALKEENAALKEELKVICYGVLAALKGLKERGCNGPVTDAIGTLEKHLNKQAHK